MAETQKMSAAMQRILGKIDNAKDRRSQAQYPYLPSGDQFARVKRVVLFKNKDDVTCFKLELDVAKSSKPGVSGIHVVILTYKGAMSDAHQEETKQILSAIMASQMDLLNDAMAAELGTIRAEGSTPDAETVRAVQNYRFRTLYPTTTGEAIEQGWLEVDFGEDDKIPATFDLNSFDLYLFTNSYDKKRWQDPKTKNLPLMDEKTGEQATVCVHNWRGCSMAELRKEGILQ